MARGASPNLVKKGIIDFPSSQEAESSKKKFKNVRVSYLIIRRETDAPGAVEVLPLLTLEPVALDELPPGGEQLDPVVPSVRHQYLVLKENSLNMLSTIDLVFKYKKLFILNVVFACSSFWHFSRAHVDCFIGNLIIKDMTVQKFLA